VSAGGWDGAAETAREVWHLEAWEGTLGPGLGGQGRSDFGAALAETPGKLEDWGSGVVGRLRRWGRISEIQFFRKRTLGNSRWAAETDPQQTLSF
jgi:hypothetical protein